MSKLRSNRVSHLDGSTKVALATILLLAWLLWLLFLFGYIGSSSARIRREHGLRIPPSAHSLVCGGDAWMHWFMDSGAASAFEMASEDISDFISQLTIEKTIEGEGDAFIFPSNSQYQIPRPWTSGIRLKTYN